MLGGNRVQQTAFLESINYHDRNSLVMNKMDDSGLQRITPLDEDTDGTATMLCSVPIEDETVFTP